MAGRLTVCMASLLTVLVLGVSPASAQQPDPEDVLDHFRCYSPEAVGDPIGPVVLRDQFGSETFPTGFPQDLCNPAQKSVLGGPPAPGLVNPDAHLVCYSGDFSPFEPRVVVVSNQFGTDALQVLAPSRLCLPSSKAAEPPFGPLPDPPPLGDIEQRLDHFMCYSVNGALVPPPVELQDQFVTSQVALSPAEALCNPVEKDRAGFPVTEIRRPFAHLVCYGFFNETVGSAPNVATRNQFGTVQFFSILTGGVGQLCVPSLKEDLVPPRVAQHFKGFRAVGGAASRELVTLVDQFGTQRVRLGAVRQLFTPVEKRRAGRDPEPIERPAEHLKCYRITGPSAARTVRIENQFTASTELSVGDPTDLCAPASKALEGDPGAPPADLNHYKCYAVSGGASVAENVELVDQFGTERVRVQRPSRLCNPVEKRRAGRDPEPPPHPTEHLVCYQMRELGDPFVPRSVFTRDQFRPETLQIDQPSRLCVPSEKFEVGGV
jgi:hypothetical protein